MVKSSLRVDNYFRQVGAGALLRLFYCWGLGLPFCLEIRRLIDWMIALGREGDLLSMMKSYELFSFHYVGSRF